MRSVAPLPWHRRLVTGVVTASLLLLAAPALAHVSASPAQVTAGEHAVIDLRVPHGCDGSPTTALSVQIPDTVASVTPEFLPGWTVETTTGPLAEPMEVHGETVEEGIREVTWSGGTPVPDGQFFDFGVSVLMPDTPGETLYFPVVQTCEDGESRWIEVPEDGEDAHALALPAPSVTLAAADDGDTGASGEDDGNDDDDHGDGADDREAAAASEPVATAELATAAGESSGNVVMIAAVAVAAVALIALLVVMLNGRRRAG